MEGCQTPLSTPQSLNLTQAQYWSLYLISIQVLSSPIFQSWYNIDLLYHHSTVHDSKTRSYTFFLVACYATVQPALYVGWLVGWLVVSWLVRHILHFLSILFLLCHVIASVKLYHIKSFQVIHVGFLHWAYHLDII